MKLNLLFVITVLLVTGCSSTDSENVGSKGIYAKFDASSNGTNTQISAKLKVGGAGSNTYLELGNGEHLTVSNGVNEIGMIEDVDIWSGKITYEAKVSGDPGGTTYTITFLRNDGQVLASSASLPEDFAIDEAAIKAAYTDQESLLITWSPATSLQTKLNISGICGNLSRTIDGNASSVTIDLGDVAKRTASYPDNCELDVELSRQMSADVNSGFGEGGRFNTIQRRSFKISFSRVI